MISKKDFVFLDLETTGLSPKLGDEPVEIAIVDYNGRPLINSYVKPRTKEEWAEAQAIHGITPQMVADSPTMAQLEPVIIEAIRGKQLVIYNANFDFPFLSRATQQMVAGVHCAMLKFAPLYGEWNYRRNSYKWQKLINAAAFVGHEWSGKAHSALADAKATVSVWDWCLEKEAVVFSD